MKRLRFLSWLIALCLITPISTAAKDYLEVYTPEENGLNLVKLTDETSEDLWWNPKGLSWSANRYNLLSVSPDGKNLAYLVVDKNHKGGGCVMVRGTNTVSTTTQRTFRPGRSVFWSKDGNIYFSDINMSGDENILSISAEQGSLVNQHSTGTVNDFNCVVDGNKCFFTRKHTDSAIWMVDMEKGTLATIGSGWSPCVVPGTSTLYCCRDGGPKNSTEIIKIDYEKGTETVILSDPKMRFGNPKISPDGRYLLLTAYSRSNISKKENCDIFVVRVDGTGLTQLTYHPGQDFSPEWSADGRSIFFLSDRANKKKKLNIWKMNFTL